MSPTAAKTVKTTREKLIDWLLAQGVSTVLLVILSAALFYFAFRGLPWLVSKLESIVASMNSSHEAQTKMIVETFDKDQKRDADHAERIWQEVQNSRQYLAQPASPPKHVDRP